MYLAHSENSKIGLLPKLGGWLSYLQVKNKDIRNAWNSSEKSSTPEENCLRENKVNSTENMISSDHFTWEKQQNQKVPYQKGAHVCWHHTV